MPVAARGVCERVRVVAPLFRPPGSGVQDGWGVVLKRVGVSPNKRGWLHACVACYSALRETADQKSARKKWCHAQDETEDTGRRMSPTPAHLTTNTTPLAGDKGLQPPPPWAHPSGNRRRA